MMPSTLASDLHEVRIYGLNKSITTDTLGEFLGKTAVVRGILLHPQSKGSFQWAQVWVGSEFEVVNLLELRESLAKNGITISRVGPARGTPTTSVVTPPQTAWDLMSHLPTPKSAPARAQASPAFGLSSFHNSLFSRPESGSSLPRNLYVLNLPLDLTQAEFKDLFLPCGTVEHSTLLSQLDGIGRRRGFVLMATHREAAEVMHQMHGKWIDGFKLDVSWALVQREAKSMVTESLPNRVVHPPVVSTRRDSTPDYAATSSPGCAVIVENLDPFLFPNTDTIHTLFRNYGPIHRVIKLSDAPLTVAIHFEHPISALALTNSNGLQLGHRPLSTRPIDANSVTNSVANNPVQQPSNFDPFSDTAPTSWLDNLLRNPAGSQAVSAMSTPPSASSGARLNAESRPFVPGVKVASSGSPFLTPDFKAAVAAPVSVSAASSTGASPASRLGGTSPCKSDKSHSSDKAEDKL